MRLLFETKVEQDIWKHYKSHYQSVRSFSRVLESSDLLEIVVSKPWYKKNSGIRFLSGAGYMRLKRLDPVCSAVHEGGPVYITCSRDYCVSPCLTYACDCRGNPALR